MPVDTIWADYCHADVRLPFKAAPANVVLSNSQFAGVVIAAILLGLALALCLFPAVRLCWPKFKQMLPAGAKALEARASVQNESERRPLLQPDTEDEAPVEPARSRERLRSLDVLRGITIALMIFVDMTGSAFPEIHHCPWNGIRLADFGCLNVFLFFTVEGGGGGETNMFVWRQLCSRARNKQ